MVALDPVVLDGLVLWNWLRLIVGDQYRPPRGCRGEDGGQRYPSRECGKVLSFDAQRLGAAPQAASILVRCVNRVVGSAGSLTLVSTSHQVHFGPLPRVRDVH